MKKLIICFIVVFLAPFVLFLLFGVPAVFIEYLLLTAVILERFGNAVEKWEGEFPDRDPLFMKYSYVEMVLAVLSFFGFIVSGFIWGSLFALALLVLVCLLFSLSVWRDGRNIF